MGKDGPESPRAPAAQLDAHECDFSQWNLRVFSGDEQAQKPAEMRLVSDEEKGLALDGPQLVRFDPGETASGGLGAREAFWSQGAVAILSRRSAILRGGVADEPEVHPISV